MADEVDVANGYANVAITMGISVIQARANTKDAEETGFCLGCGEALVGRRWCDASCRDDWARLQRK